MVTSVCMSTRYSKNIFKMFDKENFAELIRFHRFSFDMVGMEENLNISLSLGD